MPLRRAVTLLLAKKAEIVEESGRRLRASSLDLPEPLVIRLLCYVFVPFRTPHVTRRKILLRDGRCRYCGATVGPLTVDHVLPRSRGGRTTWENCVAACLPCNQRKNDRTPQEARMRLIGGPPVQPRYWITGPGRTDTAWT